MVDHLTGYPIAVPIPNKEASTVVDAFYEKVILEHTAPHIVLSDNGKNLLMIQWHNCVMPLILNTTSPVHTCLN